MNGLAYFLLYLFFFDYAFNVIYLAIFPWPCTAQLLQLLKGVFIRLARKIWRFTTCTLRTIVTFFTLIGSSRNKNYSNRHIFSNAILVDRSYQRRNCVVEFKKGCFCVVPICEGSFIEEFLKALKTVVVGWRNV